MKAYRIDTQTRIAPFGDPVGESLLGGETMTAAVAGALQSAAVTLDKAVVSDDLPLKGDFLILPDTLFLTRSCLHEFLQASRGQKKSTRLALAHSPLTAYNRPLQAVDEDDEAVLFDLFYLSGLEIPRGMSWPQLRGFLAERCQKIVLKPGEQVEVMPQSRPGPPRQTLDLPRSLLIAADVRHWAHLVWLNHQLPWVRLQEYWQDQPSWKQAWRSRGKNPYRIAARRSVIGQGCNIHPSAHIEGSILGDRVKMGPFTSVRDSIIGDDVEISDFTKFQRCVVGHHCHSLNDSYFIGSTFYPESTLASFMLRNSMLGQRVFITSGVMLWDEPIEEKVSVVIDGQEVPTGRWLLGSCAGHECMLGTRAIFLPGRTIPNRTMIVMRPEEGVIKVPLSARPGEPHVYHDGKLLPLAEALPDWHPLEIEP